MSSEVTADFDGILKKIAEGLHKNSDIDDLGSALGFDSADIDRYIKTNAQQGGNYMGTVDMLRTWRTKQTGSAEKAALRSALLKARFVNLVDQYLSTGNAGKQTCAFFFSEADAFNKLVSLGNRNLYQCARLILLKNITSTDIPSLSVEKKSH